jgi:predicted enzyme related to lactoylglutathione lyase
VSRDDQEGGAVNKNPFQHVDVRVTDMQAALPFYSKLLPAVGFVRGDSGEQWKSWAAEGELPSTPWFGFIEDPDHRPNSNRIAFWAASPDEVDRLAAIAIDAGARNMSGPRPCPEYTPSYYAAFFDDPCGNRLEICYLT